MADFFEGEKDLAQGTGRSGTTIRNLFSAFGIVPRYPDVFASILGVWFSYFPQVVPRGIFLGAYSPWHFMSLMKPAGTYSKLVANVATSAYARKGGSTLKSAVQALQKRMAQNDGTKVREHLMDPDFWSKEYIADVKRWVEGTKIATEKTIQLKQNGHFDLQGLDELGDERELVADALVSHGGPTGICFYNDKVGRPAFPEPNGDPPESAFLKKLLVTEKVASLFWTRERKSSDDATRKKLPSRVKQRKASRTQAPRPLRLRRCTEELMCMSMFRSARLGTLRRNSSDAVSLGRTWLLQLTFSRIYPSTQLRSTPKVDDKSLVEDWWRTIRAWWRTISGGLVGTIMVVDDKSLVEDDKWGV
ncbi:unnamed protein product [Amoebophrya sp. A25]|nr:unnamed protein product [Amoebophrya sp. A25]|eukprot:GSA25T00020332001.1